MIMSVHSQRHHVAFRYLICRPSILPKKLSMIILQKRKKSKELLVPEHRTCRYPDTFILLFFIFLEKVHVVLLTWSMYHVSLQAGAKFFKL